jgi:hypothetical protein
MMGVFAEFERAMIQERVKAGLERRAVARQEAQEAIDGPVQSPSHQRGLRAGGVGMTKWGGRWNGAADQGGADSR